MNQKESHFSKIRTDTGSFPLRFFSIANQLKYGLLLLVIFSLLLMAGVLIYFSFQAQQQQLEVVQQQRSRTAAVEINSYLDDLQRKLSYLARVRGLTNFSPEAQHSLLEGLIRHNSAYEMVAILDRTGQVAASVSPYDQATLGNLADSLLFARTFAQQEEFVGPVEIDPATHLPVITLAVPVRNDQDQVDGVLLAKVSLKFLWFIISQTYVGDTGYAYVLDERNFVIADKNSNPETFELKDLSDQPFVQDLTLSTQNSPTRYQGLYGQEVFGSSSLVRSTHWNVVTELPTEEVYRPLRQMLLIMGIILGAVAIFTAGLTILLSRQIVVPLQRLTEASAQISSGNMEVQVDVSAHNELGVLAASFEMMIVQLKELYATLEQKVTARTQRLEVVAALGERLSGILDQEELLSVIINEIKANFGYYHAQVYMFDEARENLVVAAGAGEVGAQMKAQGHLIPLHAVHSLVARAARTAQIVKADNVRQVQDWLPNPLLPETQSEMAVPIVLNKQVIGVLDIQEDKVAGLDDSDASLLRSLANQVGTAINNVRLFQQAQTALANVEALNRRLTREAWQDVSDKADTTGYVFTKSGVTPALSDWLPSMTQAIHQKNLAYGHGNGGAELEQMTSLAIPLTLRDEVIGVVGIERAALPGMAGRQWSEDELAAIQSVAEQVALALDSARLARETERAAWRDRVVSETTAKVWSSAEMEEVMKAAVAQLGHKLRATEVVIRLGTAAELAQEEASTLAAAVAEEMN